MQDLSRAAATALWSGMSVSSPADAAAADLHRTSGPCVSTRARKHRIPIRRPPAGSVWLPAEDPGGPGSSRRRRQGRQRRDEGAACEGRGTDRRPHGGGGGGAGKGCHFVPHSCLRAELASNSSGRSVYLVCLFRE